LLADGITPQRKALASLSLLTVWAIWNERNARVFHNKQSPTFVILDKIKVEACLWVLAGAKKLGSICQALCTSQRNQKSKLMERASTIHLYTSTPPLTCDGRRESQHVDTKGGNSNFTINCENQDSNSRPWVPC
jgi:hypothetical protein